VYHSSVESRVYIQEKNQKENVEFNRIIKKGEGSWEKSSGRKEMRARR